MSEVYVWTECVCVKFNALSVKFNVWSVKYVWNASVKIMCEVLCMTLYVWSLCVKFTYVQMFHIAIDMNSNIHQIQNI